MNAPWRESVPISDDSRENDSTKCIPANKGIKLPPEVLTEHEVQRLIGACSHRLPTGIRNRALIVTLYRGGLRIKEALSICPKDLNPEKGTIRVLNGKGKKDRTVGLEYAAFAVIRLWLDVRMKRGQNSRAPFFCTLRGDPVKTYTQVIKYGVLNRHGTLLIFHLGPHNMEMNLGVRK